MARRVGECSRCALAFDEMKGTDGQVRPAYSELARLARRCPPRCSRLPPQGSRTAVPADRHHLRGLWRGRRPGAADPVRRHPAHPVVAGMGHAAAAGSSSASRRSTLYLARHLRPARNPQGRHRARGPGVPESGVPAGDERPEGAARHLRAHRRHRRGPRRCRHLLRAGGQCPHAVRRLLHAGEPRDHDAAVSGAVLAPSRRAGRELSRRTARHAEVGRAATPRPAIRPSCC